MLAIARPDFSLGPIWLFLWTGSVLHDAWFWFVHWCMHKSKTAYRAIHYRHHRLEGDLTLYGTADMHPLEAFLLTMGQ